MRGGRCGQRRDKSLIAVVGLTGGIGSGKSAAAERFAAHGITVVDTDAIAHELTQAGGAAMAAIRAEFGDSVLTSDGALDRPAMRKRVFADASARQRLEAILHPMIRLLSDRRAASADSCYVVMVVPLLVESGSYRGRIARLLVVDCAEETQIARVMARNRMSRAEVINILAAQASRAQRLAVADDVIDNNGSLEDLQRQVDALDQAYRSIRGIFPPED